MREDLRKLLVGQEQAIDDIVPFIECYKAELVMPGRPIANILLTGPTGSGKTRTIEALAAVVLGDESKHLRVDCGEFQHSHEVAKLIGCFTPETPVLMADGSRKPIKDVVVGDRVITRHGRSRAVEFVHVYDQDGEMVEISVSNHNEKIVATKGHEILAIRVGHDGGRIRNPKNLYDKERLEWVPAGELQKHDIVVYPRLKAEGACDRIDLAVYAEQFPRFRYDDEFVWANGGGVKVKRFINLDENFARFAGYYVSDGGSDKINKTVKFTLGVPQKSEALDDIFKICPKVFGGGVTATVRAHGPNSVRINICSRIVNALMSDLFGDHTLRKRVPESFLHLPDHLLYHFIDAAIMCDGSRTVKRRVDYSTSSETLFSQMQLMLRRLGFATQAQRHESVRYGKRSADRYRIYITGEQIDKFAYMLPQAGKGIDLYNPGNGGIQRMSHVDEDYIYFRVKDVQPKPYCGKVYDLAVEEDTSYVVEIIGHNSPPGYLGHRETQPMFTQARINQWHTETLAITFLLFDELEKASDALRKIMLGILDKATLTLGDNTRVDFSKCMIFMTSNLGAKDAEGRENGYAFDRHVGHGAGRRDGVMSAAAKKLYATEFSNRIDRVIEYKPLSKESISTILDLELSKLQTLILGRGMRAFVIEYAETAHAALIEKGFSKEYGARELKRTIFRNIQVPLAQMINEQRIPPQSRVRVTYGQDKDEFSFRVAAKRGIFT